MSDGSGLGVPSPRQLFKSYPRQLFKSYPRQLFKSYKDGGKNKKATSTMTGPGLRLNAPSFRSAMRWES